MRKLLVLVILMLAGCNGDIHQLDPEWLPLEDVRERPALFSDLGSETSTTTIGSHAYVRDLDDWLLRYIPGTPKYLALLAHERVHARRQLDEGVALWIARYLYDKEFALLEEQIGYYWEITERRRLGDSMNVDITAAILSGYKNLSGKLISFPEARNWILQVLTGQWLPPQDSQCADGVCPLPE